MNEVSFSIFDAFALAAVAFTARTGGQLGFAKMVWPFLGATLALTLATFSWPRLGQEIALQTGFSPVTSALAAYATVGVTIFIFTLQIRRFLGNRLLLLIPAGPLDGAFGALAGFSAAASGIIVFFAILSPFETGPIDWSPVGMKSNDRAVHELGRAVFGTVHRAAFDDSWIGRTLQQDWTSLMIHPGADLDPDLNPEFEVPM